MIGLLLNKYVIGAVALGIGFWIITSHIKHDRENEKLIGSQAERIAQLEASLANRDADVLSLNNRIRARNAETQAELDQAEADQAKAKAEAIAAQTEKKASDVRLAQAQRKYRELLNNDQNLQNYSNATVPSAVLDRLRSANGEGNDDTVRTGPGSGSGLQAHSGGTAAGLPLPPGPLGW